MKIDSTSVLVVITVLLSGWAIVSHYNHRLIKQENEKLQADNDKQSQIIASQSFEFNRINQITSTAYRYGLQSKAKSQEKVIEYRTLLKKEPTCDLFVPQSVVDGLFEHTYRLRTVALYDNSESADAASTRSIASRKLTYCQAVEWIEPLLETIENANIQLNAIEQITTP